MIGASFDSIQEGLFFTGEYDGLSSTDLEEGWVEDDDVIIFISSHGMVRLVREAIWLLHKLPSFMCEWEVKT